MFDINTWATLKVYMEFIIPVILVVIVIAGAVVKSFVLKYKAWRMHNIHKNIVEYNSYSNYWRHYKCNDCGRKVYERPTSLNGSFSDGYISFEKDTFDKCIKTK